jgi:protein regulator of cytokinesis 1
MLWAELGTPQAQTDDMIIRCYRETPEQLGLHQDDMKRLTLRRDKLLDEKRNREKKLNNLKAQVDALWERLSIDDSERRAFLARSRGCGLKAINDFEDELSRLNELKRQNLHLFVEDARGRLQRLWDELYISEEEAVEFTPMFCGESAHFSQLKSILTILQMSTVMLSCLHTKQRLNASNH